VWVRVPNLLVPASLLSEPFLTFPPLQRKTSASGHASPDRDFSGADWKRIDKFEEIAF